jgi:uncharacterized coiled-coil protein SlyX
MKTKKTKATKAIDTLTVAELREAVANHQSIIDSAKEQLDVIQTELRRRFEPVLAKALAEQEKQHGQHTFEVDGVKLTAEITARRDWDSEKLKAIARTMPYEQVERLFTIKFSVPEKAYNAIRDEKLLDQLIDARTVKYSDPKVSFAS